MRGFRAVAHDYSTLYPDVEDPALVVESGTVSDAHGIYLAGNPFHVASWANFTSPGLSGNFHRLLLCTFESDDVLDTVGATTLESWNGSDRKVQPADWSDLAGAWSYADDATSVDASDRPYSRLSWRILTVTVVAETTPQECGRLGGLEARNKLSDVLEILDTYGWADFEPARV